MNSESRGIFVIAYANCCDVPKRRNTTADARRRAISPTTAARSSAASRCSFACRMARPACLSSSFAWLSRLAAGRTAASAFVVRLRPEGATAKDALPRHSQAGLHPGAPDAQQKQQQQQQSQHAPHGPALFSAATPAACEISFAAWPRDVRISELRWQQLLLRPSRLPGLGALRRVQRDRHRPWSPRQELPVAADSAALPLAFSVAEQTSAGHTAATSRAELPFSSARGGSAELPPHW